MKGLWSAIGKMCVDPKFYRALKELIDDRPYSEADERLCEYLHCSCGFLLSRWERGELIRILEKPGQHVDRFHVRDTFYGPGTPDAPSENFYALVGLLCLDKAYLKVLFEKVHEDLEFYREVARFGLHEREKRWLVNFLEKRDILKDLKDINDRFWSNPHDQSLVCTWGYLPVPQYRHEPAVPVG